jgi:hypothetical protein
VTTTKSSGRGRARGGGRAAFEDDNNLYDVSLSFVEGMEAVIQEMEEGQDILAPFLEEDDYEEGGQSPSIEQLLNRIGIKKNNPQTQPGKQQQLQNKSTNKKRPNISSSSSEEEEEFSQLSPFSKSLAQLPGIYKEKKNKKKTREEESGGGVDVDV